MSTTAVGLEEDHRLRSHPVFWGEIAPCAHMLQLYEDDAVFLDSLEGYVAGGLTAGEGVIVIATQQHLSALHRRLALRDIDCWKAKDEERFIALDARETLAKFMVLGWPDENLFHETINDLLRRARGPEQRKVRAFGEMVALLWASGHASATVRLEELWHALCAQKDFSLLCSYPKFEFTMNVGQSTEQLCRLHSQLLPVLTTPKPD